MKEIYDFVQHEDKNRDYSKMGLTKEEKTEVALFHSMKQDPYYKHYLYNHLRKYAEDEDEINQNFVTAQFEKEDIGDHTKFDRLNLFDFRRNIPTIQRQSTIDSKGIASGFGKRKKSRAIVQVKPGKGTVTVNGKPILQAMFLPM